MARLARVVVPGVAHHITQRGNRRQPTFFQEEDYRAYLALLERVKDWRQYLREALEAEEAQLWHRHERTGRPLGEPAFLARIERLLGRTARPQAKTTGELSMVSPESQMILHTCPSACRC